MHYQLLPMAEVKIITCLRGRVFDVIIDLRADSPTLLQWYGADLTADNMLAMYVPQGFAHGFQVLEPDSELLYFHSAPYSPAHEGGVRWDDPLVGIHWPLEVTDLSARDRGHVLLPQDFQGLTVNEARCENSLRMKEND